MINMNEKDRPKLSKTLKPEEFKEYYYLKEELTRFLKQEGLQTTGNKEELSKRIIHYLATGKELRLKKKIKTASPRKNIKKEMLIEENFVCSEVHRAFFKSEIGNTFSFNVAFQKYLKENPGKTYADAIKAYYEILNNKKKTTTKIDKQFEYNTYIRDFFADNDNMTLKDAIKCWKYKKFLRGHNKYEKNDLCILK